MLSKNIKLISTTTRQIFRSISFDLPNEIKIVQKTCRDFCESELRLVATELDQEERFPFEEIRKLGDLGLMGIGVSQEFGGANLNTLALSVAVEELSKTCASTGAIVSIHNCLYANLLERKGNLEQKQKFLKEFTSGWKIGAFALSESDAGSDVGAMSTTALKEGTNWVLNGTKAWVTSGLEADVGVVFATIDKRLKHKGITAFLVDLNSEGVTKGPNEKKMGIRATSTCNLYLENVVVPENCILGEIGEGFKISMEQLDQARIGIASQAIGISQAALDLAITYASQRKAFNKSILSLSSVQTRLAEMALKIEASRLLTWKAAQLKDQNIKSTKSSSLAKWHSGECANFCTANCIQILGAMGYIRDLSAERYYRDARVTEIYGGTTDVHKSIVADNLIKEYGHKKER